MQLVQDNLYSKLDRKNLNLIIEYKWKQFLENSHVSIW